MHPFNYKPEKSHEVYEETSKYLEEHSDITQKIQNLAWAYHSIFDLIPYTMENIWSGHIFPYTESWDELQISFTLCQFGLYKQAMVSLRSALELGLLSVYYNINDEGHRTVKNWLKSDDSKESDTPRMIDIWKILIAHPNIEEFQKKVNLKQYLLDLGYLHNFVHTKGLKFSTRLGMHKSNFQTFEVEWLRKWLKTYENITVAVIALHLLKYPVGIIKYDYSKKFGIEAPFFSHIQSHQIDLIENILPSEFLQVIKEIASFDIETRDFFDWIESLPDMTEDEIEVQVMEWDKYKIENQGFDHWKEQQRMIYNAKNLDELPENVKGKANELEKWAIENDYIKPAHKRKQH